MSRPAHAPLLPLMGKLHPHTGEPIRAIGFRRDGRPIFPIMGAAPDDPPERPEDVPEETWDALGDPGKAALVRERSARVQAERDRDAAVRERDAARARPAPPKNEPAKPETAPKNEPAAGEQHDIASIVQQAVSAAIKPFQEAEERRTAEAAATKVRDAVIEAAKPLLHDPTDALANVDLTAVVDANGSADAEKVKAALEKVIETKPHLAKATSRVAPTGIGGGGPVATPDAEKVKAILGEMQRSTGVRTATPTT